MVANLQKTGLPAVVGAGTRLLVLGSFPGEASLKLQQYYGHPRNKFWELVGAVIDVDLRSLSYEQRLINLIAHGIGLWDVIAKAERKGSLDAAIRNETHNPLTELVSSMPGLKAIAFNGTMAAKIGRRQFGSMTNRFVLIDLPSSSPAYTISYGQKQAAWNQLREELQVR
jgi:hypoxanthine-DNA glycosylase